MPTLQDRLQLLAFELRLGGGSAFSVAALDEVADGSD
jgi:hypothetical protein